MENLRIDTSRLTIRNLKSEDLNDFHVYRSNPEVTLYQGFDVMNIKEAKEFIEGQKDKLFGKTGEWVQYGIELKESNNLIGDCAIKLENPDPRIAQIGITINPTYQRKGFAKEAMMRIMTFLFDEKKVHRIGEVVDTENVGSIELLEGLYFRREAHYVENIFFNGKWGSEYGYAMLNREWQELKFSEND